MARSHWAECHSVCFPNTKVAGFSKTVRISPPNVFTSNLLNVSPNAFRLLSECFQYGSEWFPNAFRTRRIDLECTELFPHAFRTLSEPFQNAGEVLWPVHTGPNAIPFVFPNKKGAGFPKLSEFPAECVYLQVP
jgi:hypothetical protein